MRKYRIIVDDREIGGVLNDETVSFQLSEGKHTIYLRIDWVKSNKVNFVLSQDHTKVDFGVNFKDVSRWQAYGNTLLFSSAIAIGGVLGGILGSGLGSGLAAVVMYNTIAQLELFIEE